MTLIATFIIAMAGLTYGLRMMRRAYGRRLDDLEVASELLDRHFVAAERIVADPATPEDLKEMLVSFSASIGRREVAQRIARSIMKKDTPLTLSVSQTQKLQRMGELLRELQLHRPDLVKDMAEMVSAGYVSMMLRWPETEAAAMRVAASDPCEPIYNLDKAYHHISCR